MSRHLLLIGLAVALCGCGDGAKTTPVAGNNSPSGAATSDPVAPAKPEKTTNADAGDKEEMTDSEAAGKSVATEDGDERVAAKDAKPVTGEAGDKDEEKPTKITAQKAFQAAGKAMQKGDVKGALAELEKALPDNPEDSNLLLNLAALSQRAASAGDEPDYESHIKAAGYMRRALKADASLAENPNFGSFASTVYYNEACALAKGDKPAEALKVLQEAVAAGFKSVTQLEKDEDLASVRELPEFPEFLTKTRDAIRELQEKELDKIFAETKPFDFTFELTDIEGNAIAIGDLKGKVAIIDVWGTWCPPCRMEIPHFVELQTKYKEAGLEIVGLNLERVQDDEEAAGVVKEFYKENKMNYRCALIKQATIDQIPDFEGFPTTLFFDRTGKVRAKTVGYKEIDVLDSIVTRLLAEKPEADQPAEEKTEAKSDDAGK